ncbi:MAG: hypothetical protein GY811_06670 [Myxococcales bacterium]|nr:hypothetical protein [Myxococcales bacterium]
MRPTSLVISLVISLVVAFAACASGTRSDARGLYNHGIDLMAEGDLEGAEEAFVEARSSAGADQPLRYSTAFNLGMLHTRRADDLELSEPQKALAELQNARNWFQDAARVRSDDLDARANLQIVARKSQVLADQLKEGEKGLEASLDRVIEDERALRDDIRGLMEAVQTAGESADPIGFRDQFSALATSERELMADAGVVSDLAADELAGLDGQDPEQMEQQDKLRQMQLRSLDAYLQSARIAIDDTRRELRKLDGKRSHLRATAALALLKRAREQLLDPVAALKGVAQDQSALLSHTEARLALSTRKLTVSGEDAQPEAQGQIPAWLEPEHLSEREGDVIERTTEVLMRFQAASSVPPPADPSSVDPETARMLEMAGLAVPFLESTVAAMEKARDSLAGDAMDLALEQEIEAMRNLLRAIEHFSDLKNLIELTYGEQQGVLALLDPEQAAADPKLAELDTEKRADKAIQAVRRNIDRLQRMEALIAEQRTQATQQAEQEGEEAQGQAGQTFDAAETYRSGAESALGELVAALESISEGTQMAEDAEAPLATAGRAQNDIEELRRIFYTIVEHLKELHRDQSQTYDATGELQARDDADRGAFLPPLAESQAKHAALAEPLASALEKQADAASASEDPQAAQEGERFAAAAEEVRAALEALRAASRVLAQAQENATTMSVDLSPALEEQPLGLEHIQAAIEILEPPQDGEQEDQEQEQEQQDQEQQEEEISKQQAEKRLQEIRDREAERQREREEAQAAQGSGVDKDW